LGSLILLTVVESRRQELKTINVIVIETGAGLIMVMEVLLISIIA
jgi:hypothetical protein